MKRIIMTVAATLLAAVPATIGLVGNTSFAQSVPVHVPSQAVVVDDSAGRSRQLSDTTRKADDKGGLAKHAEPGDDKGGLTTKVTGPARSGDDKGGLTKKVSGTTPSGDDKGALTKHAEPGDDRVSESGSGKDGKGSHGGDDSNKSGKSDKGDKGDKADDGPGHS